MNQLSLRSLMLAAVAAPLLSMSAFAAMPNGNLCEPDIQNFCLGTQGLGRVETVRCLREHLPKLSPACAVTMRDSNFKDPSAFPTKPGKYSSSSTQVEAHVKPEGAHH